MWQLFSEDGEESVARKSRQASTGKGGKASKFKDKLKVRMLERQGCVIPHAENVFGGMRPSSFNVSSVLQSRILTFDAIDMAKVLEQHDEADADLVADALKKEYSSLIDSLKAKPRGERGQPSETEKAHSQDGGSFTDKDDKRTLKQKAQEGKKRSTKSEELEMKLVQLEANVAGLTEQMEKALSLSAVIPDVLGELARRFVPPDTPSDRPEELTARRPPGTQETGSESRPNENALI